LHSNAEGQLEQNHGGAMAILVTAVASHAANADSSAYSKKQQETERILNMQQVGS